MPLYLDEEQTMLRDTARSFVADAAPVAHMRKLRDSQDRKGWSGEVWSRFVDMGFSGIMFPEADGGLGLGALEAGIVLEELGRNLTPSPFLSTSVAAAVALRFASPQIQGEWAARFASGEATAAFALEEINRHRPEHVQCEGRVEGDNIVINGTKVSVIQGQSADLVFVSVRTHTTENPTDGLTMVAVKTDAPGVTITAEPLADSSWLSEISFNQVSVPLTSIVGEVGKAWPVISLVLDHLRTGASAELIGISRAIAEQTVAYLKERVQFDRIIGTFQALQHRAAIVYAEIEVAYAATLKAQQLLDAVDPRAHTSAMVAKAQAGWAATLAVQEGVQMHGGIGMTDEHDAGLFMKRARVLATHYGHADELADRLAVEAQF